MQVLFSNSAYKMANKNNEKREDGAYKVILGALNASNIHGQFYVASGVKELLTTGGYHSIASKISRGLLKGEGRHPFKLPGMSDSDFVNRNLIVDNVTASHHIFEVLLEETNEVEANGVKVILIWGWVKPTDNDLGRALKADLDDINVNVAFSIRCFSILKNANGIPTRYITNIVTWDWVDNPGIARAVKPGTNAPVLTAENAMCDIAITIELLEELKDMNIAVTTENGDNLALISSLVRRVSDEVPIYKKW